MCNSPLPTNTSKIHLHVIHHTENELETGKDSYATKTMRKILMELGKKGREVVRSGPVPLGGHTKEKEGVSNLSHILSALGGKGQQRTAAEAGALGAVDLDMA